MAEKSQVKGVPNIRRLLQSIEPQTTLEVREAISNGAGQILREALSRVPRKSGRLAQALRMTIYSNGFAAKIGIFGKRALKLGYYGKWVEYGTAKTPARPFLMPAFKARGPAIIKIIDAAVDRALLKASGVTSVPTAPDVSDGDGE